jgi:DNA-binding response OmpR family regulator
MTTVPKTILIVEDDNDLRHILATALGPTYTVLEAEDGQKGYTMAIEKKPDLIVLDLQLPLFHGLEVLESLRNYPDPEVASTKVLVYSNFSDLEKLTKATKLNVVDYLVKSNISADNLVLRIQKILGTASMAPET